MAWWRCAEDMSCAQFKDTELDDEDNPCLADQQVLFDPCDL